MQNETTFSRKVGFSRVLASVQKLLRWFACTLNKQRILDKLRAYVAKIEKYVT